MNKLVIEKIKILKAWGELYKTKRYKCVGCNQTGVISEMEHHKTIKMMADKDGFEGRMKQNG